MGRTEYSRPKLYNPSLEMDNRVAWSKNTKRHGHFRGVNAQERTRTSTPVRAQALNLLRMPIPPPGLSVLLLYRLATECQFFFISPLSDFAIKP